MSDVVSHLLNKKWFVTYVSQLNAIQLIVMPIHDHVVDRFLSDLEEGIRNASTILRKKQTNSYVYGLDSAQNNVYELLNKRYDP